MEKLFIKTVAELSKILLETGLIEGSFGDSLVEAVDNIVQEEIKTITISTLEEQNLFYAKRFSELVMKRFDQVFVASDQSLYGVKDGVAIMLLNGEELKFVFEDACAILKG